MTKHFNIPNPDSPKSISPNLFSPLDLEVDRLLEAPRARTNFNVDGSGLAIALKKLQQVPVINCSNLEF